MESKDASSLAVGRDKRTPLQDQRAMLASRSGLGMSDPLLRATPDFAEVYRFIGSVFDPACTDHLSRLRRMAPIDKETVLLLMRNLSINLSSPDFEEHKLFLSVYDGSNPHGMALSSGSVAQKAGAARGEGLLLSHASGILNSS